MVVVVVGGGVFNANGAKMATLDAGEGATFLMGEIDEMNEKHAAAHMHEHISESTTMGLILAMWRAKKIETHERPKGIL